MTQETMPELHKIPEDAYALWRKSDEFKELMKTQGGGGGGEESSDFAIGATIGLFVTGGCIAVMAILLPVIANLAHHSAWRTALLAIEALLGAVALSILIVIGFRYAAARNAFFERVKVAKSRAVDGAVEDLRKDPSLENLLVLNRRQLDDYHTSSIQQQRIAFRNAQIAAAIGFGILVIGAILSLRQSSDSARYVAAGLSTLGTALSAYVARVFFKSYKDTSNEMRKYYEEPFRTQQILMIERVADMKEGRHDRLRIEMVQHLLNTVDGHTELQAPSGQLANGSGDVKSDDDG